MTLLGQFLANETFFQKLISTIFLVLQLPTFIHIFQNIDQAVIELLVQTERTDGQTKVNLLVLSILQRRTNNDTQMVSWKCFYPQLYIHETPIFVENMTKNAFLGILGTSLFIFFGLWNQKLKYLIFSSFKSIICCTKYLINSES